MSESELSQPNYGYVKMMRTQDILELLEHSPLAFALASLIALRARFRPGTSLKGLNPGQAFVGDYMACGMSRQQYRTAKRHLANSGFVTFKSTNKGTVATLIDTRLFDVLNVAANHQINHPSNQQPTSSQPVTKNGKKEENEKKREENASEKPEYADRPKLSPAQQAIQDEKELKRVEEEIDDIRNRRVEVAGGDFYYQGLDGDRLKELKERKTELMERLDFRA
jgi:hypothetical protein